MGEASANPLIVYAGSLTGRGTFVVADPFSIPFSMRWQSFVNGYLPVTPLPSFFRSPLKYALSNGNQV